MFHISRAWIDDEEEPVLRISPVDAAELHAVTPISGDEHVFARPTAEMYADRNARLNASRTITASVFGDPPPGYSALDRR